ncbi:4-hydroxybutyrate CoA-transferase [Planotetraspora silvatica]|uniref:4-hydroxybutyrate CoA-transferase n=1 Tax=Planotetraspora silvatica TaxID=234614 RepID=A0A8J3USJ5_9ACTN|nr:acetyl-CoA hydrolase/transferase C-terminal domain-containing protein [Planotetraspora silvatica]GII49841.1 4-hydroxybutyrate CoA-transferase [Planotetraspora silvatica]
MTERGQAAMVRPGRQEDVLPLVAPGTDLIVPPQCGEPQTLIDTLETHANELEGVRIHQMDPSRRRRYIEGAYPGRLEHITAFLGPGSRDAYAAGTVELVPAHFSEVPLLLRRTTKHVIVLAAAAPPDQHGYFSLGTNADYVASFIGEVPFFLEANPQMPRSYGENQVHMSQVAGWCTADYPLSEMRSAVPDERDRRIAEFIADRIPDGACLQIGIGRVPSALSPALRDHRNLGVHSELLVDGMVDLEEAGALTGGTKRRHRNKHVATLCLGTRRLFDWIDDNPSVALLPVERVNDPRVIAQQPNMISINATSEVDLMGQAASETIAGRYWSGSGGQADFARGALYSEGGKGFLVTHATTSSGISRITATLTPGSAVTSLKNTADHVVTEYGVAHLRGRSLSQRAEALIRIAHPDHRDRLRHDARTAGLLH